MNCNLFQLSNSRHHIDINEILADSIALQGRAEEGLKTAQKMVFLSLFFTLKVILNFQLKALRHASPRWALSHQEWMGQVVTSKFFYDFI